MQPYLRVHFGNPSSAHPYARPIPPGIWPAARRQVAGADRRRPGRDRVHRLAARRPTTSPSAAPSWPAPTDAAHVITQATEHPAVLATCRALQRLHGVAVTFLPVDGHGLVDPAELEAAITPDTVLVSVMLANNETGTLQPIAELAAHRP